MPGREVEPRHAQREQDERSAQHGDNAAQGAVPTLGELADRVIVLLQPESGDEIQWEKAGLLEIADLIVIQKADLPGADRLEQELNEQFNLPGFRKVPIVRVSTARKEGFDELCDAVLS